MLRARAAPTGITFCSHPHWAPGESQCCAVAKSRATTGGRVSVAGTWGQQCDATDLSPPQHRESLSHQAALQPARPIGIHRSPGLMLAQGWWHQAHRMSIWPQDFPHGLHTWLEGECLAAKATCTAGRLRTPLPSQLPRWMQPEAEAGSEGQSTTCALPSHLQPPPLTSLAAGRCWRLLGSPSSAPHLLCQHCWDGSLGSPSMPSQPHHPWLFFICALATDCLWISSAFLGQW